MRTAVVAAALFILLAAPQVWAVGGGYISPAGLEAVEKPRGWWSGWFRDADQNSVDDILDSMARSARANIFIDYSRRPGPNDREAARLFGSGLHDAQYIDTLALYNVPLEEVDNIVKLPGVVMVEYQPEYRAALDVSVPSLRVGPSTTYVNNVRDMLGIRGNGTTIAIIDTGVDNRLHESLDDLDDNPATSDPKFVAGYDCSGTVWFTGDPVDNDGHGTHVAGIALGTGGPQHTYEGVAPGAKLVDIKVMNAWGTAPAGKVMEGIRWAIEHHDQYNITVLSLSLGTSTSSDGNDAVSQMVNQAVRAGMMAAVAAGNDGPSNSGLGAPAAADEAITVGATDDAGTVTRTDDSLAYYSSRGPRQSDFDLCQTDELKPELSAPGTNIMSALATTSAGYVSLSGTSMACPHVAGLCALVREANPELSPAQVKRLLEETAESRGTPYNASLEQKYGTGFGYGIADGYGAVRRALDLRSGGWGGPAFVGGGASGGFNLSMNWTRSEWTSGQDSLWFNATVPASWGKPGPVTLSGGSLAWTAEPYPVAASGQNWSVQGWLNYTGVPSAPANLSPAISFLTFAPAVAQNTSYTFIGKFEANGIAWNATNLTVEAVPAGLLRADLAIAAGDISFQPPGPSAGDIVRIRARVENTGPAGVNTELGFYDGPPGPRTAIGRSGVSVPGNGEGSGFLDWNSSAGRHTIFVRVDPDNRVTETSEGNNEAQNTISVSGTNLPPSAALDISSDGARTGDRLVFDGSGSTDPDGNVVLYNFDFGDGASTGWTTEPRASYAYSSAGDYHVHLTVQDNGAGEASAERMVRIVQASLLQLTFYLETFGAMTLLSPEGPNPAAMPVPAGSDFLEVGRWSAPPLGEPVALGGACTARIIVRNNGTAPVPGASFEFSVLNGSAVVNRTAATGISVPAGGESTVTASFDLPVASLPGSASIGLLVKARQGGSNVSLLLGAPAYASKVTVNLLEPPPLAPHVSAGKDFTGHVAEVVHLDGRGNDPEGTALLFEWDFDGDGQFDYSGATGKVDHIYQSAGTFRSVLRARDTSGLFGRSSVQLTIKDRNRPPVIQGGSPAGAVVVQEGEVQQFRVQARDPDGDRLAYSWYLDGELLGGASSESYIFRATRDNIGDRGLMVTVSDGLAGTSYGWSFRVAGRNHPPSIDARQPVDHSVSLVEGDLQRFTVAATDPDGDRLAYEWMLDADRVSSGPDFLYAPDSSSDGAHNVTVTVTDGHLNSSTGWSVRVSDLNRAPRVTLLGPPDGSVFPYGGEIFFEARASDPDGDALGFRWSSDLSGVIGTGNGITRVLSPGVHHVRLTVSDGKAETVAEATITVKGRPAGPEKAPGMEAAVLAPALVAVIALTACRRRRK